MPSPLARLDELLAAATPGPWESVRNVPHNGIEDIWGGEVEIHGIPVVAQAVGSEDAELVVWLVNHAAGLARIARAAEDAGAEARGVWILTGLEEALAGLGADSEASE